MDSQWRQVHTSSNFLTADTIRPPSSCHLLHSGSSDGYAEHGECFARRPTFSFSKRPAGLSPVAQVYRLFFSWMLSSAERVLNNYFSSFSLPNFFLPRTLASLSFLTFDVYTEFINRSFILLHRNNVHRFLFHLCHDRLYHIKT